MFAVVFRVIGSKLSEKWFLAVLAKKHGLTPWEFRQNFKFAKTFCIAKIGRVMMFAVVFRVIGSKLSEKWFLAVFGQKAWTNPLGISSKFQIC